jgi:hypothetical protein
MMHDMNVIPGITVTPLSVDTPLKRGCTPPVMGTFAQNEEKSRRRIARMLDLAIINYFDGEEERP